MSLGTGASYTDDEFRTSPRSSPRLPFLGTGSIAERIWSGPAITVTGMDVLPVDKAVNAVVPYARAMVSTRVHPEQDPSKHRQRSSATSRLSRRSASP